jgi:hypothetical protein
VKLITTVFLSLLIMMSSIGRSHAEIITFNQVDIPHMPNQATVYYENPIIQPGYLYPVYNPTTGLTTNDLYLPGFSDGILNVNGFLFAGDHFHIVTSPEGWGYGNFPENGTQYIAEEGGRGPFGHPFTMTSVDGRSFSMISFDGAESFADVQAAAASPFQYVVSTSITVTGRTADGRLLTAMFPLDGENDGSGPSPDFQVMHFPPDWVNLSSVTFSGFDANLVPGGFSVDNIMVDRGRTSVTVSNRQLFVNGSRFAMKGVVYAPVPIGDDSRTTVPKGDYFTIPYNSIYSRDLSLIRQMGANTVRILNWGSMADHNDFLDKAYNNGADAIYVIAGYSIPSGLDIDPASPVNVREQIKADFRRMVSLHKDHSAILMWAIGNDLNASFMYGTQLNDLFSLINEMATEAHAEEGSQYHPVSVVLSDENFMSLVTTYEASTAEFDIWGINAYRGISFGTLFSDFKAASSKPLVVLEYGIDAFDAVHGDEYERLGTSYQGEYAASLWNEMTVNTDVCIGGTIMEYSDEWWKGAMSTDSGCSDASPSIHGTCGNTTLSHPDSYANAEWWGIMRIAVNGANSYIVEPRSIYHRLQSLWLPPAVSLKINGGESYARLTSVTLSLFCRDSNRCTEMQFSNDNMTWSGAMPYATTRTWALTYGNGVKMVFARVKDAAGNWSASYSDTIMLDMTAPVTTATPAGGPYISYMTSQTVTLTCMDSGDSGCDRTYYTLDGTTPTTASTVYSGPFTIATTTTLKFFSTDLAGNTEGVKTQTYTLDTTPPTGAIVISGGAVYTRSQAATLGLSCSDDRGCYQMQFSNDNVTWSAATTYATTRTWAMSAGNGEKTVYVRYRDAAGNWSASYSDTIMLDMTAPVNGALTAAITFEQVSLTWSGFLDAESGIANYSIVYSTTGYPLSCLSDTVLYSGSNTSFSHVGVISGITYYYRICAVDNAGNISPGSFARATF